MNTRRKSLKTALAILTLGVLLLLPKNGFALHASALPQDSPAETSSQPTLPLSGEKQVELKIENQVISSAQGAPWEGNLTANYATDSVAFTDGMTAKDALEQYAAANGFSVTGSADTSSAYFIEGIHGLVGNTHMPEGALWSAWTYKVNNQEVWDAVNDHVLQAGDKVLFEFQAGYPNIKVEIENTVMTAEQGAPWVGQLAAGDFYYSLPTHKNVTALDVLKTFDQFNDTVSIKTLSGQWGEYVSEVNGLHDQMQVAGFKWPGWIFTVNGQSPESGADSTVLKPDDVLKLQFTLTPEEPASETSTLTSTFTTKPAVHPIDGFWPSFRGNDNNNAWREREMLSPRSKEEVFFLWDKSFPNEDFMGNPGQMILVNNELLFIQRNNLIALNPKNAEVSRSMPLEGTQGYASTPPLYADGVLYLPLDGGKVQAITADTWSTLWTYQDPKGGQCQSPLYSKNGIVYASFWQSGQEQAIVALSTEKGTVVWRQVSPDGYYFAGGIVTNDWFVTGSESQGIQVFHAQKGKMTDHLTTDSPVRTTIVRDGEHMYAIDNNGTLYDFSVDFQGKIQIHFQVELGMEVTATPIVYNEIIYLVGNGKILCLNQNDGTEQSAITIDGYGQGSPLLLTEENAVHLYFVLNKLPGGIWHWSDSSESHKTAELLYAPEDSEKQNYSLGSPISGPDGTLYFRNDSGTIFALACRPQMATSESSLVTNATSFTTDANEHSLHSGESTLRLILGIALPVIGLLGLALIIVLRSKKNRTEEDTSRKN